jgi:predicted Fe-Mo cluster-binding NifX family protein
MADETNSAGKTTHRIAASTTDGLTIHVHFGHAHVFWIYDIEGDTYEFVEKRDVSPSCAEGGHSTERFDAVLDLLADCEAVVVGKIGPGASEYLMRKGMRVFEGPGVLENVIGAIAGRGMLNITE